MNKTKIYQVKKGYDIIGSFESLDEATKLFGELAKSLFLKGIDIKEIIPIENDKKSKELDGILFLLISKNASLLISCNSG